ncbi:T9SS type A sorting domain-containing protein [Vitellibacter sp. q18]|nr:T9SS type A sorting domain-containing protein [Aequorivita lutea]
MGANIFGDTTLLNFSPDGAYAAGFDFFVSGDANSQIRIYDTNEILIDSFDLTNVPDTENFFGVISDDPIGIIIMIGANDSAELFGNLSFGIDALSVQDISLAGFKFYPNPTTDALNLSANKPIESVTFYNLLGQKVMGTKIGATASNINLGGLARGTYIMKVNVEGKTGTYKITKL